MLQPVHQAMQARETPHRDHPQRNGDRDDDGTAENIGELHLAVVGMERKMGMEKQAGGEGSAAAAISGAKSLSHSGTS